MDLTDKQWRLIEPLIPKRKRRSDGKGRPVKDRARALLNGMLWILRTGAQWKHLPKEYPPRATTHRWFQRWCADGTWESIRLALLNDLCARGGLSLEECFIDGSFAAARKGGLCVGPTKAGKGTKRMVVVDGHGTPIGICIESASPAEIKLVNAVLDTIPAHLLPEFLIGDRAYDSDPKDAELLSEYDIKLVSPNRSNRIRRTQDGRTLRRYCRRWIVERTNAWLLNFRRLANRWDHHASNYAGFLRLACIIIMLRHF